jgi:hypothetical protein
LFGQLCRLLVRSKLPASQAGVFKIFTVNFFYKWVFQGCIEKQGLFQDFPGQLLKSGIFQEFQKACKPGHTYRIEKKLVFKEQNQIILFISDFLYLNNLF